jgi:uncharacterized protein (DUF1800 family)
MPCVLFRVLCNCVLFVPTFVSKARYKVYGHLPKPFVPSAPQSLSLPDLMNSTPTPPPIELAGVTINNAAVASTAVVAATLSLAACGGGGTSAGAGGGGVDAGAAPSSAQAARFLLQAQLSASDADIAAVKAQGYAAWLTTQFAAPTSISGWDWQVSKGYNSAAFVSSIAPTDYMMWQQLIQSSDGLRRRVALALSEIMVVSSNGVAVASRSLAMAAYWDVLVNNAFGNFRTLLEDITLNPAMGYYLNIKGNQKASTGRAPDENYAREVLQLFTIGLYELNFDGTLKLNAAGQPIETYSQTDISQLARVFTGYDYNPAGSTAVTNPLSVKNRMIVNNSLHESGASTFLGTSVAAGATAASALATALNTMFNHANTAPFICKQLIQRLVTSNPTPAYVGRVAAVFVNNGSGVRGDLQAVVRAILLDNEARSDSGLAQASFGRLREPMLRLVQWARTFEVTSAGDTWIVGDMSSAGTRLGQSPLRSTSVFNFFRPGYTPPSRSFAAQGLVAPELQLTNESSVSGYLNFMQNTVRTGFNAASGGLSAPSYSAELALANDPAALMARLNLLLTANQLSAATVATILGAISSISVTTLAGQQNRVYAAVLLVMASPQYLVQK